MRFLPSKNPAQRLRDILEISRPSRRLQPEWTKVPLPAIEIVSEASRRRPAEIRNRYAETDWVAIASAGHVYRHEYEEVDDRMIWNTVRKQLSPLREMALAELRGT